MNPLSSDSKCLACRTTGATLSRNYPEVYLCPPCARVLGLVGHNPKTLKVLCQLAEHRPKAAKPAPAARPQPVSPKSTPKPAALRSPVAKPKGCSPKCPMVLYGATNHHQDCIL